MLKTILDILYIAGAAMALVLGISALYFGASKHLPDSFSFQELERIFASTDLLEKRVSFFDQSPRSHYVGIGEEKIRVLGISHPKNPKYRRVIVESLLSGEIRAYQAGQRAFGKVLVSRISDGVVEFRHHGYVNTIALRGKNPTRLDLEGIKESMNL